MMNKLQAESKPAGTDSSQNRSEQPGRAKGGNVSGRPGRNAWLEKGLTHFNRRFSR